MSKEKNSGLSVELNSYHLFYQLLHVSVPHIGLLKYKHVNVLSHIYCRFTYIRTLKN